MDSEWNKLCSLPEGCETPGVKQYFPGGQGRHWERDKDPRSGRKLPTGQGLGDPLPWGQKCPTGQTSPYGWEKGEGSVEPCEQKWPVVDKMDKYLSKDYWNINVFLPWGKKSFAATKNPIHITVKSSLS